MHPSLHQVHFVKAVSNPRDLPSDQGLEIAFAGRSNVGKSSAINALLNRKRLARISQRSGCTQQIHFYQLGPMARLLVDLPGYGFARVPHTIKAHWGKLVDSYLYHRKSLAGLTLVMDIRHPMQPFDRQLLEWSTTFGLPVHILLTKADKVNRGQQLTTVGQVSHDLAQRYPYCSCQSFSTTRHLGIEEGQAWLCTQLQLDEVAQTQLN